MSRQDDGMGLDELFDLLEAGEPMRTSSQPEQDASPSVTAPTTTMLPGPPMLRDALLREVLADLRDHGVVAGNRAVEVLRAVSAMLSDTDEGRHSGECLIATIARRTGLRVRIVNGTVFPDGPVE